MGLGEMDLKIQNILNKIYSKPKFTKNRVILSFCVLRVFFLRKKAVLQQLAAHQLKLVMLRGKGNFALDIRFCEV